MAHTVEQIRNIALTGHNGAGKTALAEAVAFNMGKTKRLGRVEEGTTISDFDKEEIERRISLKTALLNGEWGEHHFNVMDTPGYADFICQAKAALRVADASVTVLDAVAGVEVGTERVWKFADEYRVPRLIFINKLDRPDIELEQVLEQLMERFGRQVVPLQWPANPGEGFNRIVDLVQMRLLSYREGKAEAGDIPAELEAQVRPLREQLVEAVAETDEELMETYFSDGGLSTEALKLGLRKAVLQRELFPVLCGDAFNNVGTDRLLDALVHYFPSPMEAPGLHFEDGEGNEISLDPRAAAPLAAFVFKTVIEQHVGELSLLRLYAGSLKAGDEMSNVSRNGSERIGQIYSLNGHQREEIDGAGPGDMVALVKLKNTHTGDTLCARGQALQLPGVDSPEPLIRVAVFAREKGSEERMATGLAQFREEDPHFIFKYDGEIRQSLLLAQGQMHLDSIVSRLKERFGVEIDMEAPKIPYQETIRGNAEGHYRHKKQTGGRGQFGEVFLRIAPRERGEGFEFLNKVVGGNIPSNFIPAVEKGILESLEQGPLSNSRVVDVAVTVYDGKHHAVDSDEVSFKLAGSQAFKDAFLKARPVLLEPIYSLTITVPEEFMGDVMGDLSSRRGRINGTNAEGHLQIIRAEVPLAEIDRYATHLRSMTQGKGLHSQKLDRYEEVPGEIMAKVVEATGKKREAA